MKIFRRAILGSSYTGSYLKKTNTLFHQTLESIQYNAALATTGATRWTSIEKLYNELGLETLKRKDGKGNCGAF